jgi:hypothetical protein
MESPVAPVLLSPLLGLVLGLAAGIGCSAEDDEAECNDAIMEVEQFLADNTACESDDDCVYADKGCYNGPETACVAVGLNGDADLEAWADLNGQLQMCGEDCGGDECGASISCIANVCSAHFP